MSGRISIETADPRFGLADQVVWSLDEVEAVELAEDAALCSHAVAPPVEARALAFVDGVRRTEAWLYYEGRRWARSRAAWPASFGVGCVRVEPDLRPDFGEHRIERLLIWGSGASVDDALPEVEGGWRWHPASVQDVDPQAPLQELQRRMRIAEAELAEEIAAAGVLTVLDGTLAAVRLPT